MPSKHRSSLIKNQDIAAATFVVGSDLEVADFLTIQTALDNLPPEGGLIALLGETFTISASIAFPAKPVKLVGAGRGSTVVSMGANAITATERVVLIGIGFTGTAGSSIALGGSSGDQKQASFVEDCFFDGIDTLTMNGLSSSILACTFSVTDVVGAVQGLTVMSSLFLGGSKLTLNGTKAEIVGCDFDGSAVETFGIVVSSGLVRVKISACSFNGHTTAGISMVGTNNTVVGCVFATVPGVVESGAANLNRYAGNAGFGNSTIIGASSIVEGWNTRIISTTPVTLDETHRTLLVNATGGARVLNLPTAASAKHRVYTVKKTDASANTVTIDGSGAETIDGAATLVIGVQYQSYTIQSDGTEWWIT